MLSADKNRTVRCKLPAMLIKLKRMFWADDSGLQAVLMEFKCMFRTDKNRT